MRKKFLGLLSMLMLLSFAFGVSACDQTNDHSSNSSSGWSGISTPSTSDSSSASNTSTGSNMSSTADASSNSSVSDEPKIYEWADGTGVEFDVNDVTYEIAPFSSMPRTYEMTLQLPKSFTGNAGVVYGNYTGYSSSNYLTLSIIEGGKPLLAYNGGQVVFSSVDVRSDSFVHVAICIDKNRNTAKCYVNGELA
jgi:hypothetical protein